MGLTGLKEFREYNKLRLKYLKQDEFSNYLYSSKNFTEIYIKIEEASDAQSLRVRVPNELSRVYMEGLMETNLIYLYLENPKMTRYIPPSTRELVEILLFRVNRALKKLEAKAGDDSSEAIK